MVDECPSSPLDYKLLEQRDLSVAHSRRSGNQNRHFKGGNLTQGARSEDAGRAVRPEQDLGEAPRQQAAAGDHHFLGPRGPGKK